MANNPVMVEEDTIGVIELDGEKVTISGFFIGRVKKEGRRWFYKPPKHRTWKGDFHRQRDAIQALLRFAWIAYD